MSYIDTVAELVAKAQENPEDEKIGWLAEQAVNSLKQTDDLLVETLLLRYHHLKLENDEFETDNPQIRLRTVG